jgi:hypothetical protein
MVNTVATGILALNAGTVNRQFQAVVMQFEVTPASCASLHRRDVHPACELHQYLSVVCLVSLRKKSGEFPLQSFSAGQVFGNIR